MGIVVIILILLLLFGGIGTLPVWQHSADWGYGGSSVIWIILIIVVLFLVFRGGL